MPNIRRTLALTIGFHMNSSKNVDNARFLHNRVFGEEKWILILTQTQGNHGEDVDA